MILTCPECGSRFSLAAKKLGEEGKNVRCKNCSHVWFQLPDPEELEGGEAKQDKPVAEENAQREEDAQTDDAFEKLLAERQKNESEAGIPQSIFPTDDEENLAGGIGHIAGRKIWRARAGNFATGFFVVMLIALTGLGLYQKELINQWPASYSLYNYAGLAEALPGEGLVFDKLQADIAEMNGRKVLTIEGAIINLSSRAVTVPAVRANILGGSGPDTIFIIKPPEAEIEPEATMPFSAQYPADDLSDQSGVIQLQFTLGPVQAPARIASTSDGNNQVQPQDGTALQNAPSEAQ